MSLCPGLASPPPTPPAFLRGADRRGGRRQRDARGGVQRACRCASPWAAPSPTPLTAVRCHARADDEGPHNPTLNGFFFEATVLATERAAVRDCAPALARFWKARCPPRRSPPHSSADRAEPSLPSQIESSHAKNALGNPTAFKIVPGPTITPFAPVVRAAYLRRAAFLAHQLWVTPFAEDEVMWAQALPRLDPPRPAPQHPATPTLLQNYPGGDWPNQVSRRPSSPDARAPSPADPFFFIPRRPAEPQHRRADQVDAGGPAAAGPQPGAVARLRAHAPAATRGLARCAVA